MKNLKVLSLALLALIFSACSSDDDGDGQLAVTVENLSGTYEITSFNVTEVIVNDVNGTNITTTTTEIGDSFDNAIYTFNSNGTYTASGGFRIVINNNVGGNVSEETEIINLDGTSGTYTLNTDGRIIFDSDTNSESRINSLTAAELVITTTDNTAETGQVSYDYDEVLRFNRQ